MKTRVIKKNDPTEAHQYEVQYWGENKFSDGYDWNHDYIYSIRYFAIRRAKKLAKKTMGESEVIWESSND